MHRKIDIEYAGIAADSNSDAIIKSIVQSAYSADIRAAKEEIGELEVQVSETDADLESKCAELRPLHRYLNYTKTSEGKTPEIGVDAHMTGRDRIRLSIVAFMVALLIFGDLWYLYTGFRQSLFGGLIGPNSSSDSGFRYILFCFTSLSTILILKFIPHELFRTRERLFRIYMGAMAAIAVAAFAIWILAWLDGVNPVTMDTESVASWRELPGTQRLSGPIHQLFEACHIKAVSALLFSGLIGSIAASTSLWIQFDLVLDRKRMEIINPEWLAKNGEVNELRAQRRRLMAKINKCRHLEADMERECQQQTAVHLGQFRLFIKAEERKRLTDLTENLTAALDREREHFRQLHGEMDGYKKDWSKSQIEAIERELKQYKPGENAAFGIAFTQPNWGEDRVFKELQARLEKQQMYVADLEESLRTARKKLHNLEMGNGN